MIIYIANKETVYLTYEQMLKLSTKRLLAYKKKHLNFNAEPSCVSYCNCFYSDKEICKEKCYNTFIALENFHKARENILKILSTREHIKKRTNEN